MSSSSSPFLDQDNCKLDRNRLVNMVLIDLTGSVGTNKIRKVGNPDFSRYVVLFVLGCKVYFHFC